MNDGFITVQEGTRDMENGLCFGRWYSGEGLECRLCEVREECMIAMQDERKMPCFRQYDPENYACKIACHLGGDPVDPGDTNESVCAIATRGAEVPSAELTEVGLMKEEEREQDLTEDATKEPVAEAATEPAEAVTEPVVEELSPGPPPQAEDTGVEVASEEVPDVQAKPGKKKSKKAVIRDALVESPEGISADDIVTRIMDAGLATEEEMEKIRHYVVMSISHMRKAGKQIELKEGKYVLAGEQSE